MFSLKKQRKDEEVIALKYTKTHLVKLTVAVLNFIVSIVIVFVDLVNDNVPNIIVSSSYAFLWMFSLMLLRREFVKMGRNSLILTIFWGFINLTPFACVIVGIHHETITDPRVILLLTSLVLNSFLAVFAAIMRVDVGNVYSRSSSTYKQLLKSYFLEDESIEEGQNVWDKWDTIAEKTTSIIERENIKSIVINETVTEEETEGAVVYYLLEICYGKTQHLTRTVKRRFREFIMVYIDVKAKYIDMEMPEFPKLTNLRSEVTQNVINERVRVFNEFLYLVVNEKLHSQLLSKFLTANSEEFTGNRERVMSTIQDTHFEVTITKATKEESRFMTHARYEIVVKCGSFTVVIYKRFSDFKALRKALVKKDKGVDELPSSHITKSSVNPTIVKERKSKLQAFLKGVLSNPATKADKALVKFLQLDCILTGYKQPSKDLN